MATGMKQWLAMAGAGLCIVALLTLPPNRLVPGRGGALPEQRDYARLETETRREVGILQAMLWSDSLSELAVGTAVDGVATAVPATAGVTPEALAEWTRALHGFVARTEPRDPHLVFGVFWQPPQWGRPDGAPASATGRDQIFVGTRDGTPYCIQVRPEPYGPNNLQLASAAAVLPLVGLGDCRLYVKYGLPGAEIERWLEAGGFRFADGDVIPPERFDQEANRAGEWLYQLGVPVFGLVRRPVVDEYPTEGRCLGGDAGACERFLTDPDEMRSWNASEEARVEEASPLTHASRVAVGALLGWQERYVLAELEREFGKAAFARFWTSDADVSDAFREAFGTDLGSWVRDWAQERVGVHRPGPGLQAGTPLWSLLTLMLFGAIASLVGMRRRVG